MPESAPPDELGIAVDRRAEVPLGVQLAWAVRARIRDGRLRPGQRLPGLRDLADALAVNVNTVRAVYQRLEQEGLIESQQGSGTFVTSTLELPSAAQDIAASAARQARETGVDPREVAAALYVADEPGSSPGQEKAQRRRGLRAQIGALEQALIELEVRNPMLGDLPAPGRRSAPAPRLLDVSELERTQTALLRRLADIQAKIDGQSAATEPATKPVATGGRASSKKLARPSGKTRPAPA
ncbi:MAG TPA: GntR family transcriptional regulator [Solirubrobacteraceae bacterium]